MKKGNNGRKTHHYTQGSNPLAISLDGTDIADIIIQVIPGMVTFLGEDK